MKKIKFQGLTLVIENDVGSVRKGKDKDGIPWSTTMTYPYGYIENTKGMDGAEVDVFLGKDSKAKFAYVIHQTTKETGEWDEDKTMLGFSNLMEAKEAYYENYDMPSFFYGSVEAIPMETFKKKLLEKDAVQIHAKSSDVHRKTKFEVACELSKPAREVKGPCGCTVGVGDQVTVDGIMKSGIVTKRTGRRLIVKYRNGQEVDRDQRSVHHL